MDDSDQDFVDLCSKLLKRVRKKPGEPRQPRKPEHLPCSQASEGERKRKNEKKDGESVSKPSHARTEQLSNEGTEACSGDAGSSVVLEKSLSAKDKVLQRMQRFKRASPQRMVHTDKSQSTNICVPFPLSQIQASPETLKSSLNPEHRDSDEALALRLQQDLDREAAEAQTVDLEDGGLFFCQICHKDLSHMTPVGRTQHLNRCLDESEESGPAPPPPPRVPECPICGKKFKSQKSRSAHLKRCSSEMGIPPTVLLQALQRQAEEAQNVSTAITIAQAGSTKRKGSAKQGLPAKKKPRKRTEALDEDTMVALALSSSLLEQEKEQQRESAVNHTSVTVLNLRPDRGKGRGKKKKGTIPRPPPLLLIQDSKAALTRLQERVSALLLRSWPRSPPTPTRCPSRLPGWTGAAPLWQKSTLLDSSSTCLSEFYCPELSQFITPWKLAKTDAASSNTNNKPESSVQPGHEGTAVTETRASILPSLSQTASCSSVPSTPGTKQLQVGSQALQDLMDLAEDGMTLTQCGYTASEHNKDLHQSGFVLEEAEEQADLCVSGFLPETTHSRAQRISYRSGADKERDHNQSVILSRLATDLSTMVNNPQLSDVQLQVDSGDVYFAHSFMVYARCPLLAEMVYESGFGVKEEGSPTAQRVLLSDVPGQAVFALLQYLYTGHCSVLASMRPHVLELASRFDLQELKQLCELHQDEADCTSQEDVNNQTDQAFMELLRSMWNEEDEGEEETDTDGGKDEERTLEVQQSHDLTSGDREISEEKVNEEELDEIYEFAATQRNRGEESDSKEEEEEEEDGQDVFTCPAEPKRGSVEKSSNLKSNLDPDPSLDCSYSRLFSESWGVYEEGEPSSLSSTSSQSKALPPRSQKQQLSHKPSSNLSARTLLQSSASVVDDFFLSHLPSTSNLPVPGLSPGPMGDQGSGEEKKTDHIELEECPILNRDNDRPHSISVPFSPDSPQRKNTKEPELIVLSDSSEEMEVVPGPSSHSPLSDHGQQGYTQIKSQQIPKLKHSFNKKEPISSELSPGDPLDCSPEVSWLIPSTPVQPEKSTSNSSTQTKSSMCRARLFPKDEASSPPCGFSFSAISNSRLHTSDSPKRVSTHVSFMEDGVTRVKLDKMDVSRSHLDKRSRSYDASQDRDMSTVHPSPHKVSNLSNFTHLHFLQASSKPDTPLHLQARPYSSTPLHTELHQPPGHLAASPLHTDAIRKTVEERESTTSESPDKRDLGSFHLSPLSDPSDQPSQKSSAHISPGNSQRQVRTLNETHVPVQSSCHNNTHVEAETIYKNMSSQDTKENGEQEDTKGHSGEADGAENSFQHSFMDEPPIAFNDSWGLDACVDEHPGCFSLRLGDSEESSERDQSLCQGKTTGFSSSINYPPAVSSSCIQSSKKCGEMVDSSPSKQTATSIRSYRNPSLSPSPPNHPTSTTPQIHNSLLDSKIWDSWEEDEEEEETAPLSQRLNPSAQLKTPTSSRSRKRCSLVPITPMPHYSDMDTPELKTKLNRFGVRPLPKRQMILKLKEIHQYTHQLISSDEPPSSGHADQTMPNATTSAAAAKTQTVKFKEPRVPSAISPVKHDRNEEGEELLSSSQGSNNSSTAASEESERSNPELCLSSDGDSDSDGGVSASQAANRLQDRLRAVRDFILSDPALYSQILQYQPLVLSQLQERLKAAGIRLGAAKLVDYLDSQCITFTTAKPGRSAPHRKRGRKPGRGAKTVGGARGKKLFHL